MISWPSLQGAEIPAGIALSCPPINWQRKGTIFIRNNVVTSRRAHEFQVFIDTEFTDFIDTHLISIGMAAESGKEFYVEVPYPDKSCSAFVREAVIPLLGRIPGAFCMVEDISVKMIAWLNTVRRGTEDIEICFDYQTDWDLFTDVLDYRIPPWCHARRIGKNINELLHHEFHKKNNLPEHHALYDAMANRCVFRELTFQTT